MNNIFGIIVSIIYIGIIIISARLFEKAGKEASRKYIHIMLANWWIIAIVFFKNPWIAAILPAAFVLINYASYRMDLIEVMERNEGDENKKSLGTVYYALSLLILALITFGPVNNPIIGLVGIAAMGYGDGLAAVIGQSVKSKDFKIFGSRKSVAGCITMFIITLLIFAGFFQYNVVAYVAIKSIICSIIITAAEACSPNGTDNISVPLLSALLAGILM